MRIAQVAPLYESVPPKLYGGTERVVAYLADELVALGHNVTLFASGDSETAAKLISACKQSTRLNTKCSSPLLPHIVQLEQVYQLANRFDIIHFHTDPLHLPLARRASIPHVTTLHGRLDIPELIRLFEVFKEAPLVSISNSQRSPVPDANFVETVYHGLPLNLYELETEPEDYLVFLGRISPEKGVDRAIEIARKAGCRLKIAAKVGSDDKKYYEQKIRPLLKQDHVQFLGEVGEADKSRLLGKARALLFPINWPEPFGLVMIEALACGTPVIAYGNGSVPEVIDNGVTGFIVRDLQEAVQATMRVGSLSRTICRKVFEKRFSARAMAQSYLKVYQAVITNKSSWPAFSRKASSESRLPL